MFTLFSVPVPGGFWLLMLLECFQLVLYCQLLYDVEVQGGGGGGGGGGGFPKGDKGASAAAIAEGPTDPIRCPVSGAQVVKVVAKVVRPAKEAGHLGRSEALVLWFHHILSDQMM